MSKLQLVLIIFINFFSLHFIFAQPSFLTQYERDALSLNPALTGIYQGEHRLSVNYINGHDELFEIVDHGTISLSYDTRIQLTQKNALGLGFNATISNHPNKRFEKRYGFNFLTSFIKTISNTNSKKHIISGGVNLGMQYENQRSVPNFFTPLNSTVDDINIALELMSPNSLWGLNFSFGLNWKFVNSKKFSFNSGLGLNKILNIYFVEKFNIDLIEHLNQNNSEYESIIYYDVNDSRNTNLFLYANVEIKQSEVFSFLPSAMVAVNGDKIQYFLRAPLQFGFREDKIVRSIQAGYGAIFFQLNNYSNEFLDHMVNASIEFFDFDIGIAYRTNKSAYYNPATWEISYVKIFKSK